MTHGQGLATVKRGAMAPDIHLSICLDVKREVMFRESRSLAQEFEHFLIKIDLVRNRLPTHMTRGQGLAAVKACTMAAHEGHTAPPFHADAAANRLNIHSAICLGVKREVKFRESRSLALS